VLSRDNVLRMVGGWASEPELGRKAYGRWKQCSDGVLQVLRLSTARLSGRYGCGNSLQSVSGLEAPLQSCASVVSFRSESRRNSRRRT